MNAIHFPVNDIYDFLYGLYLNGFLDKSYENGLVVYKMPRKYNKKYDVFITLSKNVYQVTWYCLVSITATTLV